MLSKFWLRLKALLSRKEFDRDLEDEVEFHLAMQKARNRPGGPIQRQAREALRQFGNATLARENLREMRSFMLLETLWQDIRFGSRLLRKNPVFAFIAIVTLRARYRSQYCHLFFDISCPVAMLPVPHPQELVVLRSPGPKWDAPAVTVTARLHSLIPCIRICVIVAARSLPGCLRVVPRKSSISGSGRAELARGELVTGNYFSTVGSNAGFGPHLWTRRRICHWRQSRGSAELRLLDAPFRSRCFDSQSKDQRERRCC